MKYRCVAGVVLSGSFILAQVPQTRTRPPAKPIEAKELTQTTTVQDIKSMIEAGVSEDVILLKLRKANHPYDLTSAEIVMLKKLGASSALLQVMLDPTAPIPARRSQEPEAAGGGRSPIAPTAIIPDLPASSDSKKHSDLAGPESPQERGIYLWTSDSGHHHLIPLKRATTSSIRQSGTLTSAMTMGIAKAKTKMVVAGDRSELRVKDPQPVFYFFLEENAGGFGQASTYSDPTAFALTRLESKRGARELTGMEMRVGLGVMHNGSDVGATRKVQIDKVRPGVYKVIPATPLDPGEYAFSTLMGGQLFDFGIDAQP